MVHLLVDYFWVQKIIGRLFSVDSLYIGELFSGGLFLGGPFTGGLLGGRLFVGGPIVDRQSFEFNMSRQRSQV